MTIHANTPSGGDLSKLRIDRGARPPRPWLAWAILAILIAAGVAVYPSARAYVAERRAPEVEVVRATAVAVQAGGSTSLPVLVATGYVVARHSSDVGVKTGGRLAQLKFEEGTRVRKGDVIAEIEHADIDAQLEAARRAVGEAEAQLVQMVAAHNEDVRTLERQRALSRDGITTTAALTGAEAAAAVSAARVKSAEAAIASARARIKVIEESIENTNVRAPFDGVVIKKRAEVGETVSPFGVAGQAARDEDVRTLERQRALAKDGITTAAALTGAEAAAAVSSARVKSAEAAIASARARIRVTQEALENTFVRAPFSGVVIKKRAEVGETVSPFGVAGQSTREGGAIATIADLGELEVQTEVSENGVAKLTPAMPAEVKLQAYQDKVFKGKLRQIFPSADRAKSIVEVRVSILDADVHVKPEMTATVTFQEHKKSDEGPAAGQTASPVQAAPIVLVPKRAIAESNNQPYVWVVSGGIASRRQVTRGAERLDQVEVRSGLSTGEAVIINPPSGLQNSGLVRIKGS